MTAQKHIRSLLGFSFTLLGALLFSTKAIIVKKAFGHTTIDAITLLALRMICALPFYIGAVLLSQRKVNAPLSSRQWGQIIVLGLLGYYCSSLFDFIGLQYISAGLERLILFLYPTFTVLINTFIFRQALAKQQILALLLTYLGIALAYWGELQFNTHSSQFFWGSFMVFCCAVTYAIYIAGSGRLMPAAGVTRFTAYAMLAATGGVLVHFFIQKGYAALPTGTTVWGYGLLLAIVATVIPSFLISAGLKRVGATNVAIISSIGPVSTILQAHWLLGEGFNWLQMTGTALVIAGILLTARKKAPPAAAEPASSTG